MMRSFWPVLEPVEDRYAVEVAPRASLALMRMSAFAAARVRRQLHEIAEVAATLASPVADQVATTLLMKIDGYLVSYTVSDASRLLTVLEVSPVAAPP